jgi:hypothetical protein
VPVGRLFFSIEGDTSRLQQSVREAIAVAQDAGVKITRAGQSFVAAFDDALNPAKRLTEQIQLLETVGRPASDILKVMGDQIRNASETARANGQAIDPLVQKYVDLAAGAKTTGFSIESLGKSLGDFARDPVSAAKAGVSGFLDTLGPTAVGLAGIASAAAAAGVAIFKLAKDTADEAEQITNLSLRTGIGVERIQSLQKAAELMGVSGETVVSAVSKINLELGRFGTGGEFTKGVTALGISLEDASGKARPAVELLGELRDKLLEIEDPAERAQVATAVLGRRNQELAPLLLNSRENLFELAKQLEDTGAVMDKVALDQAMKLDEKLDLLSARFAKVKTMAKAAAVETALAVSDIFTGDFWKLLAENLAKGAGMQSAALASMQMRMKETADAAAVAAAAHEDAGRKAADAAGLAKMKEEELYNERLKLLSQGRENVDLLVKLQEAQNAFNAAIEKGLGHREKEKALNSVLAIRDEIRAREDQARAYEKALDAVRSLQQEHYEAAKRLRQAEYEEEQKRIQDAAAARDRLQDEIDKEMAALDRVQPRDPLKDLIPSDKDVREAERRYSEIARVTTDWGRQTVSIGEEMRRQISTAVDDFGRKVADSIVHWKGLGSAVKEFFSGLAESTLRIFVERLFSPLQKLLGGIVDSIFGMGKAGAGSLAGGAPLGLGLGGGITGALAGGVIGASVMGVASDNPSARGLGITGLGLTGIAGATSVATGMPLASAMGAMFTNPWTAVIAGGVLGTIALVKALRGKNAWESGSPEAKRDFGIDLSQDQFKQFATGLGLSEDQAYGIRKDLQSSPLFLTTVAGPLAQAQGTMGQFLKSLEAVKTSWGTFDFRKAFELGQATGDWAELNRQLVEAFGSSQALSKALPDFASKLAAVSTAASSVDPAVKAMIDGFTGLRQAISGMVPQAATMYETFLATGEITGEFAAKVTELGGDLRAFQEVADLSSINREFATLTDHFRQTGEVLPELRDLFVKFGGDLSALDRAAGLPGLKSSLGFVQQLSDELAQFLPEESPLEKLMSGTMDQSVLDALAGAGISPEKLTQITGLLKMEKGWDEAVGQFRETGKLARGGLLEEALSRYGGSAGQTAVSRYGEGFNTITEQLLSGTKAAMDAAFRSERTGVLDVLKKAADDITAQVSDITKPIEDQFTAVSANIRTAFQSAADAAIAELDRILAKIDEIGKSTSEMLDNIAGSETGTATTEPGRSNLQEPVTIGGGRQATGPYIDLRGATIFGYDEFARRVAEAQTQNARRSGALARRDRRSPLTCRYVAPPVSDDVRWL